MEVLPEGQATQSDARVLPDILELMYFPSRQLVHMLLAVPTNGPDAVLAYFPETQAMQSPALELPVTDTDIYFP